MSSGKKLFVFILSIPDYGYTPFGKDNQQNISVEIDRYNACLKQMALSKQVHFVDVTGISKLGLNEPQLISSDALHPSADQYRLWVDQIIQTMSFA